jgi:lipopolysaccharide/colanic/teichoic acid biosynthesis glycosyltransferase
VATNPEQYLSESTSITGPHRALRIPRTSPLESPAPELIATPDLLPSGGVYSSHVKPILDRVLGALLLVALSPLIAVVAALVTVRLGRPILLAQERAGLGGRSFRMFKFRTMLPDRRAGQTPFLGPDRRRTHKSDDDPRHIPVGRWLRKWSLDELPQLLNVVRGEMSLVGPRPELIQVVRRYEPWQHRRHQVKPGLTGLWQVSERGGDRLMHEHTAIDLAYVDRVSLSTDLTILVRTVPAVLGLRRGQ